MVKLRCFAVLTLVLLHGGVSQENPTLCEGQRECIFSSLKSRLLILRVVAHGICTCNYYLTHVAHRNAMVPAAELRYWVLESCGLCRGGQAPQGFSKAQRVECRTSLSILGTTCISRGSSFTCETFHSSRHPLEQNAEDMTCRHSYVTSGGTAPNRETPSSSKCPELSAPSLALEAWLSSWRG
jgi:hypothetical protein